MDNFRRSGSRLSPHQVPKVALRRQTAASVEPWLGSSTVQFRELTIPGVVEFTPKVYPDARGQFVAPFHEGAFLDATGHRLQV